MSYLPFNSIIQRLLVKRPQLFLPTHLSSLGWAWGNRVKIIPTQTFWDVSLENIRSAYDYSVTCRQHIMPHNYQLATSIQTLVDVVSTGGLGDVGGLVMAETFTLISTPGCGLYLANYVLYESKLVTFDCNQIICETSINEPHTLEWIRSNLVQ